MMKQKTRYKNSANVGIGCQFMNGRYIGIGPKRAI